LKRIDRAPAVLEPSTTPQVSFAMFPPRLATVRTALDVRPPQEEGHEPQSGVIAAAVALILREQPSDLELLLIQRAHHPRDPWSGHMALPGGRHDPTDLSLMHTAVRETHEETGVELLVPPHDSSLGTLPTVAPQGAIRPRVRVSPFVFGAPVDTEARVASHEIARVEWTPLSALLDPNALGEVSIDLPTGRRSFPCFHLHGDVVWGLTYRILRDFMARTGLPSTPR
jgi:8-oxo-dGTP pyrophosphatase MutT (NUDIX family)